MFPFGNIRPVFYLPPFGFLGEFIGRSDARGASFLQFGQVFGNMTEWPFSRFFSSGKPQ
jgi:hypothetical protein